MRRRVLALGALLLGSAQAEDHFFATDATTAIQRLRAALPYDAAACTSATAPDARVACAERAFLDRAAGWLDWHAAFRSAPCPSFCETCKKTSFAYQGHRRFRKGYGNHVFASLRALVVAIQQNKSAVLGFDDATRELNTPAFELRRRERLDARRAPAQVRLVPAARRRRCAGPAAPGPRAPAGSGLRRAPAARGLGPDEGRRISGRFGLGVDGPLIDARRRRRDDVRPPRGPLGPAAGLRRVGGGAERVRAPLLRVLPARGAHPGLRRQGAGAQSLRRRRPRPHLGAREQDAPAPAPRPAPATDAGSGACRRQNSSQSRPSPGSTL